MSGIKNCANLAQFKINHNKYQQFRHKKDSLKHQPIRTLKYLSVGRWDDYLGGGCWVILSFLYRFN